MKRRVMVLAAMLLAGAAQAADAPGPRMLERGLYIVQRVGMCSDCHSRRDQHGRLIPGEALRGAPIEMAPKHPIPGWAEYAPPIAGLPAGYTQETLAVFLETGRRPDGTMARPPMPPYRMDRADAQAVAAYLESMRHR